MVSFAALPPEVNSGLMYSGGGSGPMVSAATAWDRLAAELGSAATSYREVISELTDGGWQGPSAAAMAAAAAPYVEWMNITAAQAAQTASQVRSAAAAYEAAFTATVPPPVIAANRALLSSLVSTNTFGQNTAAIAANQAQYAEMWAQDATAMYSYAGHAAAAVQLTPFSAAPQETNPAAAAVQAAQAAGPPTSTVPNALQALSAGAFDPLALVIDFTTSPLMSALNGVGTLGVPFIAAAAVTFDSAAIIFYTFELMLTAARAAGGYWGSAAAAAAGADSAGGGAFAASDVTGLPAGALGSTLASSSESAIGAGVSAGLGRAAEVGGLSVPQAWAGGSDIRLAARALPAAGLAGLPQVGPAAPGLAGMGGLGGAPILGSVVNASRNGDTHSRHGARSKLVSSLPGAAGESPQRSGPAASARVVARPLSEHERNEREKLREEIAELAIERDAAARLIREAMQP